MLLFAFSQLLSHETGMSHFSLPHNHHPHHTYMVRVYRCCVGGIPPCLLCHSVACLVRAVVMYYCCSVHSLLLPVLLRRYHGLGQPRHYLEPMLILLRVACPWYRLCVTGSPVAARWLLYLVLQPFIRWICYRSGSPCKFSPRQE